MSRTTTVVKEKDRNGKEIKKYLLINIEKTKIETEKKKWASKKA